VTKVSVLHLGVLAMTLVLLLAGCGTVRAGAGAAGSPGVPSASPMPTRWVTYGPAGVQLVSVRVGGSGHVLAVAVQVPAGRDGCMRKLTARLTELGATVAYVSITFQSRLSSVVGACPATGMMTVRILLPAPLGRRQVMINSDTTTVFAPGHGALLRRCGEFGCGPFALPPPASCTSRSYQEAMLSTGPPMHAIYQVLGCDGRWLVLDVGWPGGPAGCDAPCNPSLVATRWFFRAGPHGWVTITTALTSGCTQVLKAEPRFPARLCAGLPALR
jgi:uncharacterized protein YceK